MGRGGKGSGANGPVIEHRARITRARLGTLGTNAPPIPIAIIEQRRRQSAYRSVKDGRFTAAFPFEDRATTSRRAVTAGERRHRENQITGRTVCPSTAMTLIKLRIKGTTDARGSLCPRTTCSRARARVAYFLPAPLVVPPADPTLSTSRHLPTIATSLPFLPSVSPRACGSFPSVRAQQYVSNAPCTYLSRERRTSPLYLQIASDPLFV